MIIFNTTYHVSREKEKEFLSWIRTEYIPRAVAEGVLSRPQIALVMTDDNQNEGQSYSLQFDVPSIEALEVWYRKTGMELVKNIESQFMQHVAGFSTLMQKLDL